MNLTIDQQTAELVRRGRAAIAAIQDDPAAHEVLTRKLAHEPDFCRAFEQWIDDLERVANDSSGESIGW